MAKETIRRAAVALGAAVALSLVAVTASSAAPPWGADEGAGAAVGVPAGPPAGPGGSYGGYYDYVPEAYYSPYYPYYNEYAGDDYVLARPAFPPGCGAGEPHC